jgi:plasmid stabilization system protein ParE
MRLCYTDRAKDDIDLAFEWYEKQRRGLGFEFLDCLETAIKGISQRPEMYQKRYLDFRGCVIRRFPFSVFYTVEGKEVVVHSVFDNRQDPQKRPQRGLT